MNLYFSCQIMLINLYKKINITNTTNKKKKKYVNSNFANNKFCTNSTIANINIYVFIIMCTCMYVYISMLYLLHISRKYFIFNKDYTNVDIHTCKYSNFFNFF